MKARILIGKVAVAIRPGWRPDAYAIFNVSNRNVYVIEGATDPGVGANDYSFIVKPGGSLTMPTVADNFSAVQDGDADVPVPFLIWTKDEVSPAYNVGGSTTGAGAVAGYSFGTLAPTTSAALALTVPGGSSPQRAVLGPVEGAPIRYRYDGSNPTTSLGHLLNVGDTVAIDGMASIQQLRAIAVTGSPSLPFTLEH